VLAAGRTAPIKKGKLPLSEYREVPWLIRDHSITVLPSSGSLITMRSLPETGLNRRAYTGFGDPVFSEKQALLAAEARANPGGNPGAAAGLRQEAEVITTRAIRITGTASLDEGQLISANLDILQPLPDTREEVLAIAAALRADPEKDVYLGKAASESTLKRLDLSDRRVLVFATHGLVPGDLDGLRQPALAFSSPAVTGERDSDGLLTMGEVMGLNLNADWVVLSACNTAAGHGAGSEAVSGLGQAFFYAGTRALLVSNWPVESVSARLLTTELFRQQETDPALPRAVALQKSMLKLLDEGVFREEETGKAVYAYAHPVFWAPFSLVGEGRKR
jgi:CHAT domain-containing protein